MIFTHTLKNRKRNSRADFSGEFIPQARKRDKNRILKSISVSSPVKIPVIRPSKKYYMFLVRVFEKNEKEGLFIIIFF